MSKETQDKDSHPWEFYYKETKKNISNINDSLFSQIQKLEKENLTLKEAIEELSTDNREKDQSLEDSHKIITRLNEEYTKLMREFTSLEKYTKDIENDNKNTKKASDNISKASYTDKIQKLNENLKNENEKLKKEHTVIKELKSSNNARTNDYIRLEKELIEKTQNLIEMKSEFENLENILVEKNKIISQLEERLEEVNNNLSYKEDEFKLLIKLSQELGSENKSNVEEMTKQAVNTIKLFYNTMKVSTNCENLNMSEFSSTNSSMISKNTNTCSNANIKDGKASSKNNKTHTDDHQEEKSFLSRKEIEAMLKEKKASFLLEDALTSGVVSDSNNHVMSLNFKNELLKCELFASLIREMSFVNYLSESNLSKLEKGDNNDLLVVIAELKEFFEKMKSNKEENISLEKENSLLRENNSALELISIKLKENTTGLIQKMKQRFDSLEKSLIEKLNQTRSRYDEKIEKLEKIVQKSNIELKSKNEEIKRLLVDNENLNATIDNVKKEKENLSLTYNLKKEKLKISKIPKKNNSKENKIESAVKFEIIQLKRENDLRINLEKNMTSKKESNMNISKNSNDSSYIEKKYKLKKEENLNFKLEIENLKSELNRLVKKDSNNSNINLKNLQSKLKIDKENKISLELTHTGILNKISKNNNNKTSKKNVSCDQCKLLDDKFLEFKTIFLKASTFKDLKQFYIGYEMDIEKLNTKLDEVASTIKTTDDEFSYENSEKKIKATQIREILSQVQKLTTVLSLFINNYKKDLHFFTNNLKKVFDFVAKIVYGNNSFLNTIGSEVYGSSNDFQSSNENFVTSKKINDIYSPNLITQKILILIYELNDKIFSRSDMKKITLAYENRSVMEIMEIFKFNCEVVKNNMIEKNNFETEISQFEDEFANYSNSNNNSFKTVNDRLLKLKKFEFDFVNLTEVIKNFLVVQEILIKIFENSKKNRLDILENIFYIMEETIFYKCGEFDENLFFIKKFVLGLLKNQKRILQITLEKLD